MHGLLQGGKATRIDCLRLRLALWADVVNSWITGIFVRRRVVLLHLLSHFMLLRDRHSSKTTFMRRLVASWLVRKNVHVGWQCSTNG
ncbi:hypothetical protein DMX01_02360 [Pseudomonas fulva]|nr:hypothetical protein DMX01_02360 [Pseudomonas fulva]PYC18479.1 hypothetical protein DMX00_02360 [Pseudomonas fulva]